MKRRSFLFGLAATATTSACSSRNEPQVLTIEPCPKGISSCPRNDGIPEHYETFQSIPKGDQRGWVCTWQARSFVDPLIRGPNKLRDLPPGWMYDRSNPTSLGNTNAAGDFQYCGGSRTAQRGPATRNWDDMANETDIYIYADRAGTILGFRATEFSRRRYPGQNVRILQPNY